MSAERLEKRLAALSAEGKTALVVYLTIGDPSVECSLACAREALRAGADVLELGVPFSDPSADGPVIAAASQRAIRAGGSLRKVLEVARTLRSESEAPLVLFTYLNPIVAFGEELLPSAAAEAGVDALLIVDLPATEPSALRDGAARASLALIPLVAPTTGVEREPSVLRGARGFVYYVSVTGVTGAGHAPLVEAGRAAVGIRARAGLPVVVGFGIDTPEKARAVADTGVDGVVVGSAVVQAIAREAGDEARAAAVQELVSALREALDS